MVYTSAAKGFRPGGLVPSVPSAQCSTQLPPGVTADQTRQFRSDSLWNYELGTKTSWFDRRLTVDAASRAARSAASRSGRRDAYPSLARQKSKKLSVQCPEDISRIVLYVKARVAKDFGFQVIRHDDQHSHMLN